jgi:hypothetical protein
MLRMENELLTFEVRFLRAQLGLGSAKRPGTPPSLARLSHLEDAERDLVLLVRRMATSPLGAPIRLNSGFRALERRYLHTSELEKDANRPEYLEGAERDLVALLEHMGRWPLGRLLRRKKEFRVLEQRYL